jgi:hypothetical protein
MEEVGLAGAPGFVETCELVADGKCRIAEDAAYCCFAK